MRLGRRTSGAIGEFKQPGVGGRHLADSKREGV